MQAKNLLTAQQLLQDRHNLVAFQKNVDESDVGDLKIQCANGGQVMTFPHDMIQAQVSEWATVIIEKIEVDLALLGVTDIKDAVVHPEVS